MNIGKVKEHKPGFIDLDVRHLPGLRTLLDDERHERQMLVIIGRRPCTVHLAVKNRKRSLAPYW